jgi:hypothetical protein
MEKKCVICNKLFGKGKKSINQWAKQKFCSRKCFGKSLFVKPIVSICILCGKSFQRSYRADNKYRFCSRTCAGKHALIRANKRDRTGSKNPAWKGGKTKRKDGYVYLNEFENKKKIRTLEHRRVMELYLGRKLSKEEVVHHKNGTTSDNRIENLQLCKNQVEHLKLHVLRLR